MFQRAGDTKVKDGDYIWLLCEVTDVRTESYNRDEFLHLAPIHPDGKRDDGCDTILVCDNSMIQIVERPLAVGDELLSPGLDAAYRVKATDGKMVWISDLDGIDKGLWDIAPENFVPYNGENPLHYKAMEAIKNPPKPKVPTKRVRSRKKA